jgi:hypothetical protein
MLLSSRSFSENGHGDRVGVPGTHLQRIAPPPDAVVHMQLQDAGKQGPIPFRIAYLPVDIDAAHSYAVRATIVEGGSTMFSSTTSYSVITRGAPTDARSWSSILARPNLETLRRAELGRLSRGTHWKLIDLGEHTGHPRNGSDRGESGA